MAARRNVVVALDHGLDHDLVARLFAADGPVRVARAVAAAELRALALDEREVDALVCLCAAPGAGLLADLRAAAERGPAVPIVVGCLPDGGDAVRSLLAAGAADVVALSADDPGSDRTTAQQLAFAVEKVVARQGAGPDAARTRGDVITVLGPKGGTGKTLTTCNLGVALAQTGRRVAIVDLDLQFGDVGLALALDPARTMHDLIAAGGTVDADKIEGYLTPHPSGVRALLAPVRPDQGEAVGADFVRAVIGELRLTNDAVIVDTPPGFTPAVIAAIDSSTSLCVVSTLDSLSLKNTRVALDTLELMGYPDESVQLVLNRADSDVGVTAADVEALLHRRPDVLIPSSAGITRAVNEGRPIVASDPDSAAARAFGALARAYWPAAAAPESPVPSTTAVRWRRPLAPVRWTIRKAAA